MPNITGFVEHPQNPQWIALTMDDGSQSPFAQDPDGSYRQQASEIAQKIKGVPTAPTGGMAPQPPLDAAAPAGMLTEGFQSAMPNDIAMNPAINPAAPVPDRPAQRGVPQDVLDRSAQASRDAQAQIDRESAERTKRSEEQSRADAQQMSGAKGYQLGVVAGTGPQVTTTHTTQSGGLAPEDRKRVDAANQSAVEAQHEADQAALRARTEQVNTEWNRLSEQEKSKLAEETQRKAQEADFTQKVDAQTRKLEDIASRPIDPSKAFAGDAGYYAFMAGFGDSIQNFGAALAGRGPVANPGKTIDNMIERSVQLQTQQQEQEFKAGRLTADQLEAERSYVRVQLQTVGKQLADTQLQRANNEQEKIGLTAMSAKMEADRKASIAKNAAATARTQQISDTTQKAPGAPGGVSLFLGEKPDWDAVKAHSEKQAGADQVERGVGRLEKAAGWTWDEKGNNGAGGYVGADGKPVTADSADPSGVSVFGHRFTTGEGARELNGALEDMAAGGAKVKDPIGAVSDKSVAAEKDAMAAHTDEGILRAAERTRRNLRGMKAGVDSGFSPGVVNASRYRRSAETEFRNNQPGLPRSREATSSDLRGNP